MCEGNTIARAPNRTRTRTHPSTHCPYRQFFARFSSTLRAFSVVAGERYAVLDIAGGEAVRPSAPAGRSTAPTATTCASSHRPSPPSQPAAGSTRSTHFISAAATTTPRSDDNSPPPGSPDHVIQCCRQPGDHRPKTITLGVRWIVEATSSRDPAVRQRSPSRACEASIACHSSSSWWRIHALLRWNSLRNTSSPSAYGTHVGK